MKRKMKLATVVLAAVASLCVAGCTVNNTSNPTATQSPSSFYQITTTISNATSKAITDSYAKGGYDIVKSFAVGTDQYGNDIYAGVVKDNSSSHVTVYEHNITIEIMKNKNETVTRASQLRDVYNKQGYYIPGNLSGGINGISSNDPTRALTITLCDPNYSCISYYTLNRFMVIVDTQTKIG